MKQPWGIDDLLERAVSTRREQGADQATMRRYERSARTFSETYKAINGTSEYSSGFLEKAVRSYREKFESGSISLSTLQKFRRIGADVEDVADYGTISYESNLTKWGKPRNELLRPVSDEVRLDRSNVIGLSLAALSKMEESGYSKKTLRSYINCAFPWVIDQFRRLGATQYSDESLGVIIDKAQSPDSNLSKRIRVQTRIAALHIRSIHHTGELCPHTGQDGVVDRIRKGSRGPLLAEYVQWRTDDGIKDSSIETGLGLLLPFLEHLCPNGLSDLAVITRERVRDARSAASDGRSSDYIAKMLTSIRSFARFVEERHPECPAFGQWIGKSPRTVQRRPVEGYTPEHAAAIVEAVDSATDIGKRDRAIIKLAETTGMRSCDIATLRLADIDWRYNEISVVQEKTGVAIILPLDVEAGEAIATYLLEARKPTGSDTVFLTAVGTAKPMKRVSVGAVVRRHAEKACGSDFKGRHGTHAFRRGLGAKLVAAEVPIPDVADILGQTRPNSAQPFVAVATERLRICCAGLDDVPIGKGAGDGE